MLTQFYTSSAFEDRRHMTIAYFDHVAIPIADVDAMLAFYEALKFTVRRTPPFYSVHFGDNKINFHGPQAWQNQRLKLCGSAAAPGCGDFCFVWAGSPASLAALLNDAAVEVIEGPVVRSGARGGGRDGESVYVRDPDQNLLEFIIYDG
ncbi:MAG: hypothetical protein P8Y95_10770 [Gammaproteobacteria bacterium]